MLVTLGAVVAYVNQVFGDMGTQSYTCVFLLAPLLALAGQLAMSTGAWEEGSRLPAPGSRLPAPGSRNYLPSPRTRGEGQGEGSLPQGWRHA